MKWVTREHPKTDRVACPWLIRKFIDAEAELVYVPRDRVLAYAEREGATSFDAPGARTRIELPVYDALYACAQGRVASDP